MGLKEAGCDTQMSCSLALSGLWFLRVIFVY